MHKENAHALSLVRSGHFGEVNFTRMTLMTNCNTKTGKENLMREILSFVRSLHQDRIDTVYASSNPERSVYLISLQFFNYSLSNILLDFSFKEKEDYLKKFEIAGSDGIYQYNSSQENTFHSTFLKGGPYKTDLTLSSLETIWLDELLKEIELSISKNILV